MRNAPVEDLYRALEHVQALLPPGGGFAVGAFSVADVAVAPFLGRARVGLTNEIGAFPEGEGKKVWATITSGRFARLAQYMDDLFARESFKATFDEVRRCGSCPDFVYADAAAAIRDGCFQEASCERPRECGSGEIGGLELT